MKTITSNSKIAKEEIKNPCELFFEEHCSLEWTPLIKMYKADRLFEAGEKIFTEGDKVEGVYFLNSGKVKVVSLYGKNQERIMRLAADGQFLGHRGLSFDFYPVSAIALTDCSVSFIPLEIFIKLIKTNPDFSIFMINYIIDELHESEERMKNMIHHDVKMRIADIICMLIDGFGYDKTEKFKLSYTLSRKDIANIAGTTYETVIRILFQLQKIGLVKLDGKKIVVKKEFELRKIAGQKIS